MRNFMNKKYGLLLILFFVVSAKADFQQGVDYIVADNPSPIKKDGVVEVIESFWYGCQYCYSFEPFINTWAKDQGDSVKLVKIPVTWGGVHRLHASLFHTIESLKLDPSTHSAVFVTIHKEGNFLQSPKAIQKFLENFGVAPELTTQYLNSFTVKQRINRGIKHGKKFKVDAVPTIIVDGKYIVRTKRSFEETLEVVDYLVELQKPQS